MYHKQACNPTYAMYSCDITHFEIFNPIKNLQWFTSGLVLLAVAAHDVAVTAVVEDFAVLVDVEVGPVVLEAWDIHWL